MKKIFASFGWMLLLLPLISVAGVRTAFINTTTASYAFAEERSVSGFTGIASGGSFKVHVQFGAKESLRLEGNPEVLREIETVVENRVLKIRTRNSSFWKNLGRNMNIGRVDIYITAIKLNSLTVSGSGDMDVNGVVRAERMQMAVSGSGSLTAAVSCESYLASVSGSGRLNVTGTTKTADINVTGSGDFRGRDLKSSTANASVSGSGSIYITADNAISARVSGSGSVRYAGNATKVTSSKSGSGSVSRI